jgi:hypothetical protein
MCCPCQQRGGQNKNKRGFDSRLICFLVPLVPVFHLTVQSHDPLGPIVMRTEKLCVPARIIRYHRGEGTPTTPSRYVSCHRGKHSFFAATRKWSTVLPTLVSRNKVPTRPLCGPSVQTIMSTAGVAATPPWNLWADDSDLLCSLREVYGVPPFFE